MHLKEMMVSERPREKLYEQGVKSLSNAELLGIVLQSGSKSESAVELGQKVLSKMGDGLDELSHVTLEELMSIHGIGVAKACQITAAVELGKRVSKEKRKILGRIHSPQTVVHFFQEELKHENKEKFIAVFLNTKNVIMSYAVISIGSLNASIVHPREVFNLAIRRSAASILLIHNHPSGYPEPSKEDEKITKRLKSVGELVGIQVLDHLIITDDDYYSFKECERI